MELNLLVMGRSLSLIFYNENLLYFIQQTANGAKQNTFCAEKNSKKVTIKVEKDV